MSKRDMRGGVEAQEQGVRTRVEVEEVSRVKEEVEENYD